jgi:hypothetical protein
MAVASVITSTPTAYSQAVAVTLSDSTELALTSALWIMHTTAFAVSVVMSNGDIVVFEAHASGAGANILLPIRVTKVRSTGSTAGIKVVALY